MTPLTRMIAVTFFLSIAGCSSPSTNNGDLPKEQVQTDRADKSALEQQAATPMATGANNETPADTPINSDNYAAAMSAQSAAKSDGSGPLPLRRGVYVAGAMGCKSPANAGLRIWNGTGLSGSATRNCRPTITSRDGDTYKVSNSCENTYDGSRTAEAQTITVPDATHFTLNGQSFRMCPAGEAPAELEKLAR